LEKQENISLCGLSGLGAMRGRSDKLGSLAKYAKGAKEEDQETFLGGLGAKIFLEVVLLNIVSVKTYAIIEGCVNSFCLSGNAPLRPAVGTGGGQGPFRGECDGLFQCLTEGLSGVIV
jgi:hypothetical protein